MTTIFNPAKNEITVQFKEGTYTVPAEGYLRNVPEKVAKEWKDRLHKFLILSDDSAGLADVAETPEVTATEIVDTLDEAVVTETATSETETPETEIVG